MKNKHDEIKDLLKATRNMLSNSLVKEETERIKKTYGMLTEEDVLKKYNVGKAIEDSIEDDEDEEKDEYEVSDDNKEKETADDKKQGYRISGGILVLHGKDNTDLELTTDEKIAFQETMDEFVSEVSDLVDFNKLNVYSKNVEWSGKIIDFEIEFFYSIGEENGVYMAMMYENGNDFLCNKITEDQLILKDKFKQGTEYINKWWKKHAISRYTKLHDEGRIKPEHLFYIDAIGISWEEMKAKYLSEVGR